MSCKNVTISLIMNKISFLNKVTRSLRTSCRRNVSTVLNRQNERQSVEIQGWVKNIRKMRGVIFVDVNDGTTDKKIQIVLDPAQKPVNLVQGASVKASGNIVVNDKGQVELKCDTLKVIGECSLNEGYPFAPRKTYTPEYVRDYLHLRSRTARFSSLLRVRDVATFAFHKHLRDNGFVNVHTPILTSNDCEGAGEVFTVTPEYKFILKSMKKPDIPEEQAYFDGKAFLTVSGQLHLEAVAHGIAKVYTFGPTFRAENSRSRFHLSEFYMLEAEEAFVDSLEQVTSTVEDLIKDVTGKIWNECAGDVERIQEDKVDTTWIAKKFPVLTYDEAVEIVSKKSTKFNALKGFTKEEEIMLVRHNDNVPVFIINWPKLGKPFYMREHPEDTTKVSAFDLLAPHVGEIVGGSLRENRYNTLKNKLPDGNLDWYLDLRKFGSVPTGGFGLGFERFLQSISGINSIKDVIPFPRWPHNCKL